MHSRRIIIATVLRNDGAVDVELLRPERRLVENDIQAGQAIQILLPEIGVEGIAYIRSIQPCPRIESGEGSKKSAAPHQATPSARYLRTNQSLPSITPQIASTSGRLRKIDKCSSIELDALCFHSVQTVVHVR